MPKYNPNDIWKSPKKEEDIYPPSTTAKVRAERTAKEAGKATVPAAGASGSTIGATSPGSGKPQAGNAPAQGQSEGGAAAGPFFKKTPIEHFDRTHTGKSHVVFWAIGVFVVLFGVGAAYFFLRPAPGPDITIGFTNSAQQVLVGDPFTLSVSLANNSEETLSGATLSLTLPQNISSVDGNVQTSTGDIAPGAVSDVNFDLIVTGNPNSVQKIAAALIYSTGATSKTQLETDATDNLVVGGEAIALSINAPTSIFSGQAFQVPINYVNNTPHSFDNVVLNLEYPSGFSFLGSTIRPGNGADTAWELGTISPESTGTVTITGSIVGSANANYSLSGTLAGSVVGSPNGSAYTLTSGSANLAIGASPLSLAVSLNNTGNYVAHTGDALSYTVSYANNSGVTFENVTISANLMGAMFDPSTITSNGTLNSITNTITWNAANTPALLNVAPGAQGTVTFTVRTKAAFPIRLPSDKDYTLQVGARISSPTVPPGTVASSTVSATSIQNKVGGALSFQAEALHTDKSSGILNSGPYPPKVNQATEYTIHWIITNYSTDLQNVAVSAYLQSGTTCTGTITSNIASSTPTCNAANGLVTWNIPFIPATAGVTGAPVEAVIQVTNTPAVNQVGSPVTLLGPTALTATDAFTGVSLQGSAAVLTTQLSNDPSASSQSGNVTQ